MPRSPGMVQPRGHTISPFKILQPVSGSAHGSAATAAKLPESDGHTRDQSKSERDRAMPRKQHRRKQGGAARPNSRSPVYASPSRVSCPRPPAPLPLARPVLPLFSPILASGLYGDAPGQGQHQPKHHPQDPHRPLCLASFRLSSLWQDEPQSRDRIDLNIRLNGAPPVKNARSSATLDRKSRGSLALAAWWGLWWGRSCWAGRCCCCGGAEGRGDEERGGRGGRGGGGHTVDWRRSALEKRGRVASSWLHMLRRRTRRRAPET